MDLAAFNDYEKDFLTLTSQVRRGSQQAHSCTSPCLNCAPARAWLPRRRVRAPACDPLCAATPTRRLNPPARHASVLACSCPRA